MKTTEFVCIIHFIPPQFASCVPKPSKNIFGQNYMMSTLCYFHSWRLHICYYSNGQRNSNFGCASTQGMCKACAATSMSDFLCFNYRKSTHSQWQSEIFSTRFSYCFWLSFLSILACFQLKMLYGWQLERTWDPVQTTLTNPHKSERNRFAIPQCYSSAAVWWRRCRNRSIKAGPMALAPP